MAGILNIQRHGLMVILVLALLVRCLIPSGFMPGQSQDGAFSIVICTAMGIETIRVDAAGHEIDGDHSQHSGDAENPALNCPFAPVLAMDLQGQAPALAMERVGYAPVAERVHIYHPAIAQPRAHRPQAPPFFSV